MFLAPIFEGFGPGFQRFFFIGFSNRKCVKKATWRKVSESHFVLETPIRNRCRHSCDKAFFHEKSMKNRMVFGTSILTGFHWTPPRGGHRRLPICVQEWWGTAMHWRLASAGLHCWRHMGKRQPTFWLQFAQTLQWIYDAGKKHFLTKGAQKTSNIFAKSVPKPVKIEARGLQNRAKSPLRRHL